MGLSDLPEQSDSAPPALPFSCYRNRPKAAAWAAFFVVLTALGVWGILHPSTHSRFGPEAIWYASWLLTILSVLLVALFASAVMMKRGPALTVERGGLRIRNFQFIPWADLGHPHRHRAGTSMIQGCCHCRQRRGPRLAAATLRFRIAFFARDVRLVAGGLLHTSHRLRASLIQGRANIVPVVTTFWKRFSAILMPPAIAPTRNRPAILVLVIGGIVVYLEVQDQRERARIPSSAGVRLVLADGAVSAT